MSAAPACLQTAVWACFQRFINEAAAQRVLPSDLLLHDAASATAVVTAITSQHPSLAASLQAAQAGEADGG